MKTIDLTSSSTNKKSEAAFYRITRLEIAFGKLLILLLAVLFGLLTQSCKEDMENFPSSGEDGCKLSDDCLNFSNSSLEVKQVEGRWKIVDGSMWLLDFESNEAEAKKAFQIIKTYGMNSQCFVGRPDPSMEYYLIDGQAPEGEIEGEDAVQFDPEKIEVVNIEGRWKIVEGSHWIMDFEKNECEARKALKIIKQYRFEYICFVGRPDPSMVYFRKKGPKKIVTPTEDCISFNPKTTVASWVNNATWKIVDGNHWILDFQLKQDEVFQAERIIKHYGFNSICFVGRPDPSMMYFLVDGKSPVGAMPGEDCVDFNPDNIEVAEIGGRWKIIEGNHWIMDFEASEEEARTALDIIQYYKFTNICFVGRPGPSMVYFRK